MDDLLNTNGLREKHQQLLKDLDNAYMLIKNYEELVAELRYSNDNNLKNIAHDLSNPLQILAMTIESLQESTAPKDLTATFARMRRSTDAMTEIITAIRKLRTSTPKKTIQIV